MKWLSNDKSNLLKLIRIFSIAYHQVCIELEANA